MTAEQIIGWVITFVSSVAVSSFIAGRTLGRMLAKLEFMSDRLAKIEGMFEMRLRDGVKGD